MCDDRSSLTITLIVCDGELSTPNGARLESKLQQGGIPLATPLSPEGQFQSLPPILGN